MNQTPPKLTFLIVGFIGCVALIGTMSLCLSMFIKTWSEPQTATAVIGLTVGALGTLGGILANTRSAPTGVETTTQTQMQTTQTAKADPVPAPTDANPLPVILKQPQNQPVPTTDVSEPHIDNLKT